MRFPLTYKRGLSFAVAPICEVVIILSSHVGRWKLIIVFFLYFQAEFFPVILFMFHFFFEKNALVLAWFLCSNCLHFYILYRWLRIYCVYTTCVFNVYNKDVLYLLRIATLWLRHYKETEQSQAWGMYFSKIMEYIKKEYQPVNIRQPRTTYYVKG